MKRQHKPNINGPSSLCAGGCVVLVSLHSLASLKSWDSADENMSQEPELCTAWYLHCMIIIIAQRMPQGIFELFTLGKEAVLSTLYWNFSATSGQASGFVGKRLAP